MKKILFTMILLLASVSFASAEVCTIIDFNDLETGEKVYDQYPGLEFKSSVTKPIVFDSANPTGEDNDLATKDQGKILIIAEDLVDGNNDGLVDDPDDNANGGTITLRFISPVSIKSVTAVDIEGAEKLRLRSKDGNGNTIATTFATGLGDSTVEKISLTGHDQVINFKAKFTGSGSIDDIEYCTAEEEVPEFGMVASVAIVALAGLFIYKKRN